MHGYLACYLSKLPNIQSSCLNKISYLSSLNEITICNINNIHQLITMDTEVILNQ